MIIFLTEDRLHLGSVQTAYETLDFSGLSYSLELFGEKCLSCKIRGANCNEDDTLELMVC